MSMTHIPLDYKNIDTIMRIQPYIEYKLREQGCCTVHIRPEIYSIDLHARAIKIDDNNITVINSEIRPEFNNPTDTTKTFIETMMDMWLKFGATRFLITWNRSNAACSIMFDKGMDKDEQDDYWKKTQFDGYDTKGNFWKREWFKPDQTTGGGKI